MQRVQRKLFYLQNQYGNANLMNGGPGPAAAIEIDP